MLLKEVSSCSRFLGFNFSVKSRYFQNLSSTSLKSCGLSVAEIESLKLSST